MPSLPSVVLRTCQGRGLFVPATRVLAAVSGGPDSVAMLFVLAELRSTLRIDLGVAHFNHHIRGEDADADAGFVARTADKLGLPLHTGEADVPAGARSRRMSLEAAAREARYSFLRRTARAEGYRTIATGHTLDDQAETVLLALLRGTGLDGLGGMAPLTGEVARPLIEATRAQVLEYLRLRGIQYRTDHSNMDLRYTRNRIRHTLIPLIEREFSPKLKAALARQAELLRDERLWLDALTAAFLEAAGETLTGGMRIDRDKLGAAEVALRRRAVREAARIVSGRPVSPLGYVNVEDVLGLLTAKTGQSIDLPGGLKAKLDYGGLEIVRKTASASDDGDAAGERRRGITIAVPGKTVSGDGRWRLNTSVCDADQFPPDERTWRLAVQGDGCSFRAVLDCEKLEMPLEVRCRRPGDRFWPHGAPGERKLQDFLTDAAVPRAQRDLLPLVVDRAGRVTAVLPLRAAHWARVKDDSEKVLVIEGQITEVPFLAQFRGSC